MLRSEMDAMVEELGLVIFIITPLFPLSQNPIFRSFQITTLFSHQEEILKCCKYFNNNDLQTRPPGLEPGTYGLEICCSGL
jgi:hypothetical protein